MTVTPRWFDAVMDTTVTFEPCTEYVADHHDGVCEACGWLAADHGPAPAVVITLPVRESTPLRRAS
jgi:hypothetical protein